MPEIYVSTYPRLIVEPVPVTDLTSSQICTWRTLIESDPRFSSPFFSPGYSRLVGRCVENVIAGLMILNGQIVGVFPYELEEPGQARPVGSVFCDYQGVIVRPDIRWRAEDLMIGCALEVWRFNHLVAWQPEWIDYHRTTDVSWLIDLAMGFDAYTASLRKAKRKQLIEAGRKRRMAEREVGPVSFIPQLVDHDLLDTLLAWKSAQWERSGWPGRFTTMWEQKLMHMLLECDEPNFAGLFSMLRIGGRPAAMHIGMRSRRVWHYWTTAYDPTFRRYSPGILMLVEMLRHMPSFALNQFDMGKEEFEYKRRLHTHVIQVAEGVAKTSRHQDVNHKKEMLT